MSSYLHALYPTQLRAEAATTVPLAIALAAAESCGADAEIGLRALVWSGETS